MRILYLTNISVPYRMKFFNELGKKCDLTVLIERDDASNRNVEWLSSVENQNFNLIYLKSIKIGEESSLSFEVIKYLRNDYDLIIVGGYSTLSAMVAILYLKIKKKKFVLNADGGFINYNEIKFNKLVKKFFISSAEYWLTTSKGAYEYLEYYGANPKNVFIYPFSSVLNSEITMITEDERKEAKLKLGISSDKKMILTVGQVIHRKGYDLLLNVNSLINQEHNIYIIGGKPTTDLAAIINEQKIQNVFFIDFLGQDELSLYYKAADVFVFPTRFDVWGLVVNESMAFSLPIISSSAAGAALEMVENGENGFIFESENLSDFADKLNIFFSNDKYFCKMSKKSYEMAQKYTIESMAESHFDIFNEILKGDVK